MILGKSQTEKMIVCTSFFEIMCPEPGRDQNNLLHTDNIMVHIHIMLGHLFDNSIKMVNWLLDHNLRELGKLKVSSCLPSENIPKADRNFGYLPATVWPTSIQ